MRRRVLICGSRDWTSFEAICNEVFARLEPGDIIIHGGARGADNLAGQAASKFDLDTLVYPAKWEEHGKAAGPIRNSEMISRGHPHEVWAFTYDIQNSRGTRDMVTKALAAKLPVFLFNNQTLNLQPLESLDAV